MAVFNINLFSLYLKHGMDVTIILPDDISSGEKLKCVWMYHGGSGDHTEWLYHTNLVDTVNERHFAAVLPNVHESCFTDMYTGNKYGTYVGKELVSVIWNMFRCISDRREDNYIAGFSNGGYGCLNVALNNPGTFSKIGAFSAGDKADAEFINDGSRKALRRIRQFGDSDIRDTKYCLTYLADEFINTGEVNKVDKLYIYHACGGKDPWLDMNRKLRDYFKNHEKWFKYEYEEIDNLGHEWKFWETELERFLEKVL